MSAHLELNRRGALSLFGAFAGGLLGGGATAKANRGARTSTEKHIQGNYERDTIQFEDGDVLTAERDNDVDPSITFREQESDGSVIVLEEVQTNQSSDLYVSDADDETDWHGPITLDEGVHELVEFGMDYKLEETQEVTALLFPEGGGNGLARAEAKIHVVENPKPYEEQNELDFIDDINDLIKSDHEFDDMNEFDMFRIFYYDEYESDVTFIEEKLANAKAVWESVHPRSIEDVYDDFVNIKLHRPADWGRPHDLSAGQYYGSDEVTHSRIQFITPSERGLEGDELDRWYRKNMIHEFGHILQTPERIRGEHQMSVPRWFIEGQVEYIAVFESDDEIAEHYLNRDNWQRIAEQLENGGGHVKEVTDDAYQGGSYLVKYMVDEWGHDAVHDLLAVDVPYFGEAIKEQFGVSPFEFERQWLLWINDNLGGEYLIPEFDSDHGKLYELQEENTELQDSKEELREEHNEIQDSNEKLKEENDALRESNEELKAENTELQDNNRESQERVESLETDLEEAQQKIAELDSTKNDLNEKLEARQEKQDEDTKDDAVPGFGLIAGATGLASAMYLFRRNGGNE